MIESTKEPHFYPQEEEKIDNPSLTSDLNVIIESEDNIKNKEDEHLSEEESLGYNSNYKLHQHIKEQISKRKASTLSTNISQTDTYSESNLLLPLNNTKSQNIDRKDSYSQQTSHIFFGRERLNSTPITTYFEGMDFYLRSLQPEKNKYKKSNNYIEKEKFFKEKNISYNKYKSFDLSEQQRFNSNQILKNLEDNYKKIQDNKSTSSLPLENNININNYQNTFTPVTPKFNNCMYGKFDMPMYYFGYYNIDCK